MIPIFSSDKERIAFEEFLKKKNFMYYMKIVESWKDHFYVCKSQFDWMNLSEESAKSINEDWKWNTLLVNLLDSFRLKSLSNNKQV